MSKISVNLCGVELQNPTVLASGILGVSAASLKRVAEAGAGAVTTKSLSLEERKGFPNPTVAEVRAGLLNCIGLSSPPLADAIKELSLYKKITKIPLIVSVQGHNIDEFVAVVKKIQEIKPSLIELNTSCPHVYEKPIAYDPELTHKLVASVKDETKIPIFVKLSPNTPDITSIAKKAEEAGANGITAINSLGPGMVINIKAKKPVLSNKKGGMSGPAIKPIAIRCVYEIYEAVKLPIIGVGGIASGKDAVEMMMAGATAVGLGTAVWTQDIKIFKDVSDEIMEFIEEEGYKNIKDIVGVAHGND